MPEKQGTSDEPFLFLTSLTDQNLPSRFNSTLTSLRRANLAGVYDSHTNLMFYPKIMQPSHVRWEQIDDNDPDHALSNGSALSRTPQSSFKPVPAVVSRNLLVTDTYFESPPISNLGVPGPDGNISDLGPNGLSTISQEVLDELPEDCRQAFEEARQAELDWKSKWGNEHTDGSRGKLRIGFNGFPV